MTLCPQLTYVTLMDEAASQYRIAFCGRIKQAREQSGKTQAELGEILGIPQGRYKHYEVRSFLPHIFVRRFCLATDVSPDWLFAHRTDSNHPVRIRRRRRPLSVVPSDSEG